MLTLPASGGSDGWAPCDSTPLSNTGGKVTSDRALCTESRAHHPEKLARYSRGRDRSLGLAEFLRAESRQSPMSREEALKRAAELEQCGGWLEFRDFIDLDEVRLMRGRFCQQPKLCSICALRRAGRSIRRAVERVQHVLGEAPNLRPYLVTVTVRNGPDLAERFAHLARGLRCLLQRRRNAARGAGASMMRAVEGGIWSVELKRGDNSAEWHPHSHAVWLSRCEPSAVDLSREWRAITSDSFVVDVQPFRCPDDPGPDLCEVFKYALKLGDLSFGDNLAAFVQLRGRRLIGSFGNLFGVKLEDESLDVEEADRRYVDLLYRHVALDGYRLVRSRVGPPICSPHCRVIASGNGEEEATSEAGADQAVPVAAHAAT